MKNESNIWLKNLELWLECCLVPDDQNQPSVNIMNPYQDDDGEWLVSVSTNHEVDFERYEHERFVNDFQK